MARLFMSLLSVLLLANVSGAQEQAQHPIDKALEACIDKNGSTAGMVECTDKAYAAWDKELNKNYGELMRALKPKQKEALRLAQLEWIKYRDLEFKLIDSIYETLEGTMYIPMRIDARMEVIKKRAVELKDHLDLTKDAGQLTSSGMVTVANIRPQKSTKGASAQPGLRLVLLAPSWLTVFLVLSGSKSVPSA
jgi:uncharacterized protein YecT (DUF1311 family)